MRLMILPLLAAACAGSAQPGAALPEPAPATRSAPDIAPVASPQAEPGVRGDDVASPPPALTPEPTMRVTATASRLSTGEIAVDLQSDGWPGRAENPALVIADQRFEDSEHTHPTALRFVLPADVTWVAGAPASVAYGDDEVARVELPEVAP